MSSVSVPLALGLLEASISPLWNCAEGSLQAMAGMVAVREAREKGEVGEGQELRLQK